jgi:hypothetical protein
MSIKRILFVVFLIGLVCVALNLLKGTTWTGNLSVEDKPTEVAPDPLMDWVENKLIPRENCPPEGMEDGGSKSYGPACFKERTFVSAVRDLEMFPFAEDQELINLTSGKRESADVAYAMIKKDYDNWRHWENTVTGMDEDEYYRIYGKKGSTKGIGLPPKT